MWCIIPGVWPLKILDLIHYNIKFTYYSTLLQSSYEQVMVCVCVRAEKQKARLKQELRTRPRVCTCGGFCDSGQRNRVAVWVKKGVRGTWYSGNVGDSWGTAFQRFPSSLPSLQVNEKHTKREWITVYFHRTAWRNWSCYSQQNNR